MPWINMYVNKDDEKFLKIPLSYQFYIYYYRPFVHLNDLTKIHPHAVGLFRLTNDKELMW